MPAGVLPLSERLQSDFRFLRSLSISQVVIGVLALPYAFALEPLQTAIVIVLILVYAAAKVVQFVRMDRTLKQLRLEDRFFRQHLDESMLLDCLRRSEHLWDDSHTLRGLRGVQTLSLPRLLSKDEKRGLVQRKYHAVFRSLIPSRIAPEVFIPAFGFGVVVMGAVGGGTLVATMFIVSIAAALVMELVRIYRVLVVRGRFQSFERALSTWTLTRASLFKPDARSAKRPYRHQLLYRTEPVFSIKRALNLRRAQF